MMHKWDSKVGTSVDDNIAKCVKCGMLKQTIRGKVAYFRDDTSKDQAGNCDERLLKGYIEPIEKPKTFESLDLRAPY